MANGDGFDGQSPTGQTSEDQNQPVHQPNAGQSGGQSGMSAIDEGWGEGAATIDEVVDNTKAYVESLRGPLLMAWLAYAGLTLVLQTVEVGLNLIGWALGAIGGIFALITVPLAILVSLAYVGVTAGQLTLYGPMRESVFHGIEPDGWMGGIKQGLERFLPVLVAVAAIALLTPLLSICLLVPGLAFAFFTSMAPYYLATRDDIPLGEGFTRSYEMAKKYWKIVAVTIGALFAAGLVAGCAVGVGAAFASLLPEPLGSMAYNCSQWVGITLFQFGVFVVWGGVFTTVDAHESGESVQTGGFDADKQW